MGISDDILKCVHYFHLRHKTVVEGSIAIAM